MPELKMKPHQLKAERERRAKVKMRDMARRIPNNEVLARMLLQMEKPFRHEFMRVIRPHLKFIPIRLEVLDGSNG